MKTLLEKMGEVLKDLMEQNKCSTHTLASTIGVTHPTILNYMKGTSAIPSDKLLAICNHFEVEFDYFFKEESFFRAKNNFKEVERFMDRAYRLNWKDELVEMSQKISLLNNYYKCDNC